LSSSSSSSSSSSLPLPVRGCWSDRHGYRHTAGVGPPPFFSLPWSTVSVRWCSRRRRVDLRKWVTAPANGFVSSLTASTYRFVWSFSAYRFVLSSFHGSLAKIYGSS
jgi:hypothetical protein